MLVAGGRSRLRTALSPAGRVNRRGFVALVLGLVVGPFPVLLLADVLFPASPGETGYAESFYFVSWGIVLPLGAGFLTLLLVSWLLGAESDRAAVGTEASLAEAVLLSAIILWYAGGFLASVKRLHDCGRSGRWALLGLLPLAIYIVVPTLALMPGRHRPDAAKSRRDLPPFG